MIIETTDLSLTQGARIDGAYLVRVGLCTLRIVVLSLVLSREDCTPACTGIQHNDTVQRTPSIGKRWTIQSRLDEESSVIIYPPTLFLTFPYLHLPSYLRVHSCAEKFIHIQLR
jgi:hypothetical protein